MNVVLARIFEPWATFVLCSDTTVCYVRIKLQRTYFCTTLVYNHFTKNWSFQVVGFLGVFQNGTGSYTNVYVRIRSQSPPQESLGAKPTILCYCLNNHKTFSDIANPKLTLFFKIYVRICSYTNVGFWFVVFWRNENSIYVHHVSLNICMCY